MAALSQLSNHIEALEIKIDVVYDLLRKVLAEVEGLWETDSDVTLHESDEDP